MGSEKKIAICLLHPWYLTSWFETGILEELSKLYVVTVLSSKEIIELAKSKYSLHYHLEFIEIKLPKPKLVSRAYFYTALVVKRKINPSFRYRIRWLIFGEIKLIPAPLSLDNITIGFKSNVSHLIRFIRNYFYQIPIFFPIFNRFVLKILSLGYRCSHQLLPDEFNRGFDIVIFVSGAEEINIFEMIKELRQQKVKTALCIENWDNLTSKRFMINHPDFVLVMGKSSADLASYIHKIPGSHVISAGLPRFNVFRSPPRFEGEKVDKIFTILYLGFYLPHNEIRLLNNLVSYLNDSDIKGNFRIVYKPHPGARARYLDDQVTANLISTISSEERKNPVINQSHISLMQSADIIISTPTSMVIECMLLGKKIVLDLTNDGFHRTTARINYDSHIHFRELDKIKNLKKCTTLDQIKESILGEFTLRSPKFIKYSTEDLIENTLPSYSSHIIRMLS